MGLSSQNISNLIEVESVGDICATRVVFNSLAKGGRNKR